MENSMFIARIVGPYCMIVALGALLNLKFYQQVMDDFLSHPALLFMRGAFALVLGLTVLQHHNVWTPTAGLIITILAWGAVAKGAYLTLMPSHVKKVAAFYKEYPLFLVFVLISAFMLGIGLTIFGYVIEPDLLNQV